MIILLSVVILILLFLMERKRRTTEALIENMKEEALLALDNTNKSAHDEGYKEGVRFISKGTFELHRNQLTSKK